MQLLCGTDKMIFLGLIFDWHVQGSIQYPNRLRILTMTNQTFCRVQSKPDECNFSYSLEMNNSVGKQIVIHTLSLRFLKFKYNI